MTSKTDGSNNQAAPMIAHTPEALSLRSQRNRNGASQLENTAIRLVDKRIREMVSVVLWTCRAAAGMGASHREQDSLLICNHMYEQLKEDFEEMREQWIRQKAGDIVDILSLTLLEAAESTGHVLEGALAGRSEPGQRLTARAHAENRTRCVEKKDRTLHAGSTALKGGL